MKLARENSKLKEITKAIEDCSNPLCCIDVRPDFDALVSAITFKNFLKEKFNKNLKLTFPSTLPEDTRQILEEYLDISFIELNKDPKDMDLSSYDLLVCLDTGNEGHLSKDTSYRIPRNLKIINIDHHTDSNTMYGDLNYVIEGPSTISILYDVFKKHEYKLTKTTATLFLFALLTDSGYFQYDKTRPKDLIIASKLLQIAEIKLSDIINRLEFHQSPEIFKLKKISYKNLTIDLENKIAYSFATLEDFKEEGLDPEFKSSYQPADGIRQIEGTNFAVFIKEKKEVGMYSLAFRSRLSTYDVAKLASKFGGGGHVMSAGALITDGKSVHEVIERIIKEIQGLKQ